MEARVGQRIAWALSALVLAANAAGYALDLYGAYWWFDRVLHAATLFAVTFWLAVFVFDNTIRKEQAVRFVILLSCVGIAIGADLKIPIGKSSYVRPGLQLAAQRLIPRHVTKDPARIIDELPDGSAFDSTRDPVPGAAGLQTNNPGYPGFASGGYLWSGSLFLEIPL